MSLGWSKGNHIKNQGSIAGGLFYDIDFSINGLSMPYKIKVNECKYRFGQKNRVNSSNFNATILKFSEKFDHPFSHVFIFGNIFSESRGFVAMPVTSRIIDTCSNLSLSNIVKGDQIVLPCDRHRIETMTLGKHVTKYKNMRKWMVKFIRKFENRAKVVEITPVLITKIYQFTAIYFNFVRCSESAVMLISLN